MKKKIALILLCVVLSCAFLCGCSPVKKDKVVLTPSQEYVGQTLSVYMQAEKDQNKLDFTIENSMVVSLNGVKNTTNTYWMLYTDDAANSDADWGTITHEGKTYALASLGAESIVIADGCTYIWVFTKF